MPTGLAQLRAANALAVRRRGWGAAIVAGRGVAAKEAAGATRVQRRAVLVFGTRRADTGGGARGRRRRRLRQPPAAACRRGLALLRPRDAVGRSGLRDFPSLPRADAREAAGLTRVTKPAAAAVLALARRWEAPPGSPLLGGAHLVMFALVKGARFFADVELCAVRCGAADATQVGAHRRHHPRRAVGVGLFTNQVLATNH